MCPSLGSTSPTYYEFTNVVSEMSPQHKFSPVPLSIETCLSRQRNKSPGKHRNKRTYQTQKSPDGFTRLCANSKPVFCSGSIEHDVFKWFCGFGLFFGEVGGLLRDGVVGSDYFEGFGVAGGSGIARREC